MSHAFVRSLLPLERRQHRTTHAASRFSDQRTLRGGGLGGGSGLFGALCVELGAGGGIARFELGGAGGDAFFEIGADGGAPFFELGEGGAPPRFDG